MMANSTTNDVAGWGLRMLGIEMRKKRERGGGKQNQEWGEGEGGCGRGEEKEWRMRKELFGGRGIN